MRGGRSTEARQTAVIVAGLVVAGALFLRVDPYLGGIVLIIDLALAMAFFIMGDTEDLPQIAARLSEDARKVVFVNLGNDRAFRIHVTLVPLDREFDLAELPPDASHEFPLASMVAEAKALVTYESADGRKFSRSIRLSATDRGDEDLLKPPFPVFGWK